MIDIQLPSEKDPVGHKKKLEILEKRNELVGLLEYELGALNRQREFHGPESVEASRAENRYDHLSRSYGEEIDMWNEKLYGKQGRVF